VGAAASFDVVITTPLEVAAAVAFDMVITIPLEVGAAAPLGANYHST